MTCPTPTLADAAAPLTLHSAMAPHTDEQAPRSGPVTPTEAQPSNGTERHITRRCARMTFRSGISRGRYLAVHRALGRCSDDA